MATTRIPAVVLVPGYWLGAWAWDGVAAELGARGVTARAVTLTGLDPDDPTRTEATVADQATGLAAVIEEAGPAPVLVVHSGAGAVASVLLDRDPACVSRVVYVDSGPSSDGGGAGPDGATELRELPLPPWDELEGSIDGLDDDALRTFRDRAVPEPGPVLTQPVRLTNPARRDVPTTMICCSFPSEVVMQMARSGDPMMAETATLTDLALLDLPTGHWPMWSRTADLAAMLAEIAHASAESVPHRG